MYVTGGRLTSVCTPKTIRTRPSVRDELPIFLPTLTPGGVLTSIAVQPARPKREVIRRNWQCRSMTVFRCQISRKHRRVRTNVRIVVQLPTTRTAEIPCER